MLHIFPRCITKKHNLNLHLGRITRYYNFIEVGFSPKSLSKDIPESWEAKYVNIAIFKLTDHNI